MVWQSSFGITLVGGWGGERSSILNLTTSRLMDFLQYKMKFHQSVVGGRRLECAYQTNGKISIRDFSQVEVFIFKENQEQIFNSMEG